MFRTHEDSELKRKIEGKREAVEAIVDNVVDHIASIEHTVKEQLDASIERAKKAGRTVNGYAKENPMKFAGMALAAGFLAGWLLKKKD